MLVICVSSFNILIYLIGVKWNVSVQHNARVTNVVIVPCFHLLRMAHIPHFLKNMMHKVTQRIHIKTTSLFLTMNTIIHAPGEATVRFNCCQKGIKNDSVIAHWPNLFGKFSWRFLFAKFLLLMKKHKTATIKTFDTHPTDIQSPKI